MPDQWERHARSKDGSGDWDSVPSRRQARDAAVADQEGRESMSDEEKVLAAIRSFSFSDYGCDDMDEIVSDPDLDVGPHLAAHIARALQGGS
jgi:hypothetical protein